MKFRWSDAWLLQAITLASSENPATLAAVIGVADAVQKAIPTLSELHGGLHRLTAAGYVEESTGGFATGIYLPAAIAEAIRSATTTGGCEIAAEHLNADPWRPGVEPETVTYPGLTPERFRAAYEAYVRDIGSAG